MSPTRTAPHRPPQGPSAINSAHSPDTSGGAGRNPERRPTLPRADHFAGDALFFWAAFFWAALNSATLRWCSS